LTKNFKRLEYSSERGLTRGVGALSTPGLPDNAAMLLHAPIRFEAGWDVP